MIEPMPENKPQILLTNDDGIQSPGLWAAAETLSRLGFVTVAAPREQSSGSGRSLPSTSDGIIRKLTMSVHDQEWTVHSVGGTPAQSVLHAILEIMPEKPDLVVSGINYGENVGTGITVSGTVGAALEASEFGVPGLAVSLQMADRYHLSYSTEIDFSAAAHFVEIFARQILEKALPADVDVLKVDVPTDATPQTPWEITRVARHAYYELLPPIRQTWEESGAPRYRTPENILDVPPGTDIYALLVRKVVSVTPLSLDMTSRIDLREFDSLLRS